MLRLFIDWASDPAHSTFLRTLVTLLSLPGILWGCYLCVRWLRGQGIDHSIDDILARTKELQEDFKKVIHFPETGRSERHVATAEQGSKVSNQTGASHLILRLLLALYFAIFGPACATVIAMYFYDQYVKAGPTGDPPHAEAFCTPGKVVMGMPNDTFQIAFLIVDYSEKLRTIISGAGRGDPDLMREVFEGIRMGTVQRFSGPGILEVHLSGVDSHAAPREVYYLASNICKGTISLTSASGEPLVSVPLSADQQSSEVGILFPKEFLDTPDGPRICYETTFPIIIFNKKADQPNRPNMTCGLPSGISNALRQGKQMHRYLIIHGTGS